MAEQECRPRSVKMTAQLLAYSLGDEMYKWCRTEAIHEPVRSKLDETRSSSQYLRNARGSVFGSQHDYRLDGGSTAEAPVFSTWWLKAW